MRTVLIVLLVLILGMATCGYLTYRMMKPQIEQMSKVPPTLEKARVVTGEDGFHKEPFYEPGRNAGISYVQALGRGDSASYVVVSWHGAEFLDAQGKQQRHIVFEGYGQGALLADLDGNGQLELINGSASEGITVYDDKGKQRWKYKAGWAGMQEIAAGDVDGDGKQEVALVASGFQQSIHLLDLNGAKLWEKTESNVRHVEIVDTDGDGRDEILHNDAQGDLVVWNAKGEVLSKSHPAQFLMNFSPVRWKGEPKPTHLLVCDTTGIHLLTGRGEKVADLEAQRFEGFNPMMFAALNECRGTSVQFSSGTFFATLADYPLWHRAILYLHNDEMQIAYQEVFAESCKALASRQGKTGETLLVACEDRIWEVAPAGKSARPTSAAKNK